MSQNVFKFRMNFPVSDKVAQGWKCPGIRLRSGKRPKVREIWLWQFNRITCL